MALTEQEAAQLAALQAKAAEPEVEAVEAAEVVVESAGEVAAEVGAAVAESVAEVAESVAHAVAHAVTEHDGGESAAIEELAERVELAELIADTAVTIAIEAAEEVIEEGVPADSEELPGAVAEVPAEEVTEAVAVEESEPDALPGEHSTHPWFRPLFKAKS